MFYLENTPEMIFSSQIDSVKFCGLTKFVSTMLVLLFCVKALLKRGVW